MIFSEADHYEMVHDGRKTQTRRDSDRYQVGKTYAVQKCRTCKGSPKGRILVTRKWKETNPYEPWKHVWPPIISWEDAQAEGGYAPSNYEGLYEEMHKGWKERWCYEFEFWSTEELEKIAESLEEAKHRPSTAYSQQLRNSDPSVSAEADELETAKSETPIPASSGREKEKKQK